MKRLKLSTLEKAANEIAAGRLWRAKEILSGSLGGGVYSASAFAAYGRLLAQMGDTKEAGKYLFLSGIADHSEQPHIELFLNSVRGKPYRWIYSQFPAKFRRRPPSELPPSVTEGLRALGFPKDFRPNQCLPATANKANKWAVPLATMAGLTFLGIIVLGLFHGLYVIAHWLFGSN